MRFMSRVTMPTVTSVSRKYRHAGLRRGRQKRAAISFLGRTELWMGTYAEEFVLGDHTSLRGHSIFEDITPDHAGRNRAEAGDPR